MDNDTKNYLLVIALSIAMFVLGMIYGAVSTNGMMEKSCSNDGSNIITRGSNAYHCKPINTEDKANGIKTY